MTNNAIERAEVTALQSLDEKRLKALVDHVGYMFNVDAEDMGRKEVRATLMRSLHMCVTFGLLPAQHMSLIPFPGTKNTNWKKTYQPHIGPEGRLLNANRWVEHHNRLHPDEPIRWMTRERIIEDPEERQKISTQYDADQPFCPEDRCTEVTLLRSDEKRLADEFGIEYTPRKFYGWWRKQAIEKAVWENGQRTNKSEWQADTIPTGRTPQDVATRRALLQAYQSFPLIAARDYDPHYEEDGQWREIENDVEMATAPAPTERAGDKALMQNRQVEPEENGDLLYATPKAQREPEPMHPEVEIQPMAPEQNHGRPVNAVIEDTRVDWLDEIAKLQKGKGKSADTDTFNRLCRLIAEILDVDPATQTDAREVLCYAIATSDIEYVHNALKQTSADLLLGRIDPDSENYSPMYAEIIQQFWRDAAEERDMAMAV